MSDIEYFEPIHYQCPSIDDYVQQCREVVNDYRAMVINHTMDGDEVNRVVKWLDRKTLLGGILGELAGTAIGLPVSYGFGTVLRDMFLAHLRSEGCITAYSSNWELAVVFYSAEALRIGVTLYGTSLLALIGRESGRVAGGPGSSMAFII